jgi:3-oxoacyl-[acyl-carrier-protein] synthase II
MPPSAERSILEALGLRCRVSGRLGGVERAFAQEASVSSKEKAYFGRFSQIGFLAAREALLDAGFVDPTLRPYDNAHGRGGVFVGSGIGAISELEDQFRSAFGKKRPRSPGHAVPLVMPSFLPAFLAGRLRAALGGATLSLACNSGLVALDQALSALHSGRANWVLVGGVEEDSPYTWSSFDAMRALARTPPECDPSAESRPFCATAHGIVPSGAGAFVLVESEAHAKARGARSRGIVRACHHWIGPETGRSPTAFDPEGYCGAIDAALAQAGLGADDIELVIPHANSTPADEEELWALDRAFSLRKRQTPVVTPKSLIGHAIGASGVVDLIVLLLQLERGHLLANHHVTVLRPGAQGLASSLMQVSRPARLRRGIKMEQAFGNSNAAVIVEAAGDGEGVHV